ncbi:MAG: adenosylcobalamin-dependent ribonucleoside-diphosphate reductase [Nitrospirae bacterium]|nr:MAG: adenosylcobalamin-dependent ribonucleoside-diphosphate reductase [Nitrospirota bacterium]
MRTLSKNALTVLRARYLLKDENGRTIETPEEMFKRVAKHLAKSEKKYCHRVKEWEDLFFEIMADLRFLPNSPTLMNAGKPEGQLAACFVLPLQDSMKGIFDTLKNAALILQSGGGTGFSFSSLRPRSDIVRSTGGIASGPVSFMKIYNKATEVIKQGGARRGANMGILRVDHPDIMDFIKAKTEGDTLTNFNISVAVTDSFIKALKKDGRITLRNPRTGKAVSRLKAKEIFDALVKSAWQTGDPGVIFIDRINRANPTPHIGEIESTNPCGEQPLLPYEACVLGSLNLSRYVKSPLTDNPRNRPEIDFNSLGRDIEIAVRLLDDAIDASTYPLKEIERMHLGNRKIGLGVMGWADMLVMMGIPYDSADALALAETVMGFIQKRSKEVSRSLAKERGGFPNFKGSVYDLRGEAPLRNATTTTIAPTGTLSLIAGCSAGIEPYYALAYKRLILETEFTEINRIFLETAKRHGFYSKELKERVILQGTLRGIRGVPSRIKRLFKTALEISPEWHVEMQAAFQRHVDNAVSKTVNLPHSARPSDVARVFLLAYEKGCKGVTVFRAGTKKRGTLIKLKEVD